MIVIYGRPGCGACENVKMLLSKRNVEFSYIDSSKMDEKGFDAIMSAAESAGVRSFPIIMRDGQICTIQEALK